MKIINIPKEINLNQENHEYSWEGKDKTIPCLSVSQVLHGVKAVEKTPAMEYGTQIHGQIQEYLESSGNSEPAKEIAHFVNTVQLFKSKQLSVCEKPFASLIQFLDGEKMYLCGTPDLIIDDMLFEFKTGGAYPSHKDQVDFYALLTGTKSCLIIYEDSFTKYSSYPISKVRELELEHKLRARLKQIEQENSPVAEIENETLIELFKQKEDLKDQLKFLEGEISEHTADFSNNTIINGILKYSKQLRVRKDVDRKLVEQKLPQAIEFTHMLVTRTSWVR